MEEVDGALLLLLTSFAKKCNTYMNTYVYYIQILLLCTNLILWVEEIMMTV